MCPLATISYVLGDGCEEPPVEPTPWWWGDRADEGPSTGPVLKQMSHGPEMQIQIQVLWCLSGSVHKIGVTGSLQASAVRTAGDGVFSGRESQGAQSTH
jgi:hypothetical protein